MTEQVRRLRLVVGVGPSETSQSALRWALEEAERRDGVVIALTVWAGGSEDEQREQRELLLTRVGQAIAATGVRGRTQAELVIGSVAEVLTEWAAEADVLVLGDHHEVP